jgi:hypothetical protein
LTANFHDEVINGLCSCRFELVWAIFGYYVRVLIKPNTRSGRLIVLVWK